MHHLQLLIRGVLAGLIISAPVGPVNVLCISRTLTKGRVAGLVAGLGAAVADTIYGSIAAFSISVVIGFLYREESWIRLVGGLVLLAIGFIYYRKQPRPPEEEEETPTHSDYVSTFLLTLTNPTTVLSFLAVLAALHLGGHKPPGLNLTLVLGIFAGAMLWWAVVAVGANHFQNRIDERAMRTMNRVAGFAIGGFGIAAIVLAFTDHPRW